MLSFNCLPSKTMCSVSDSHNPTWICLGLHSGGTLTVPLAPLSYFGGSWNLTQVFVGKPRAKTPSDRGSLPRCFQICVIPYVLCVS